ncbi:MAG: hypothetical protein LIP77_01745 [Planctomycetes bacterium]|nr:hypothetical protein [Planctomycetota bacterium]
MMTDKQLCFSEDQALASGAESENVLDIGPGDLGLGNNISLFASVKGAPASDLEVVIMTSGTADKSDPQKVAAYHATAADMLAGGKVIDARVPTGCRRYLWLEYNGVTGGTVFAGLAKDV